METPQSLNKMVEDGIASNMGVHNPDYDFMLERCWTVIHEATQTMHRYTGAVPMDSLSDKEHLCMLILLNCVVDAHSAFHSLKSGFQRAAAITARGMLENLCLAIAIKGDESDAIFKKYKENKYHIPNAVTAAKAHFGHVGTLYGVLTNKFAHEPYDLVGRAFIQQGSTITFLLIPPVGQGNFVGQFVLLLNLGLLVGMLGEVTEWTFANRVAPETYWDIEDNDKLKAKSCKTSRANIEMAKKLETILPKP